MSKHTSKLDELTAEREHRLTQPRPETGAFYTAEFNEDDDSALPSWCRTNRLHTPGRGQQPSTPMPIVTISSCELTEACE
jgi:hypothetical protein